jgi:hypothetical protein
MGLSARSEVRRLPRKVKKKKARKAFEFTHKGQFEDLMLLVMAS